MDEAESRRANGPDWDRYADEYQATHGAFLGDVGFVWGPEGLIEAEAGLLGDARGRDVLEVGSGAGQCSRWVRNQGAARLRARPLAPPAPAQPAHRRDHRGRRPLRAGHGHAPPLRRRHLRRGLLLLRGPPVRHDIEDAVAETARVLRAGGRYAFSITHPTRWMFPDDPGDGGLVASQSYWDRTPYVEVDDESGTVAYVEHHRTLGDWVRLLPRRASSCATSSSPNGPSTTTGLGRLVTHPWPAHPRHRYLRGGPARPLRGSSRPRRPRPLASPGAETSGGHALPHGRVGAGAHHGRLARLDRVSLVVAGRRLALHGRHPRPRPVRLPVPGLQRPPDAGRLPRLLGRHQGRSTGVLGAGGAGVGGVRGTGARVGQDAGAPGGRERRGAGSPGPAQPHAAADPAHRLVGVSAAGAPAAVLPGPDDRSGCPGGT